YAGSFSGFFKTTSGGAAWAPVFDFPLFVGAIAIAPSDPLTVLIVVSGGVAITHDGFQTEPRVALPNYAQVSTIALDPSDSAHLYAGCCLAWDGFVATLSADGSRVEYGTYLGGSGSEVATGIALDPGGNRYLTGETFSEDFPTVQPIQSAFGGLRDV